MDRNNGEKNKFITETLRKVSHVTVLGFSMLFLLALIVLNACATAYVAYDDTERVRIVTEFPFLSILIGLLLVGILFCIVTVCEKWGQKGKFKEDWLYFFFCGLYLVGGGLLISHVGGQLREEPLRVYETARQFARGDYQALQAGGYIFHKAHQLGMVTYERILGLISTDVNLLFWVNLIFANGINYLTYKLSDLIFRQNRRVNVLTICLSYFFLPQFFFVVFAYGLLPGFFFMLLGIYLMERYFVLKKKYGWILGLLSVSVAALLKSNYLIAGITIALMCILHFFKKKEKMVLLIGVLALLLPVGAVKALPWFYHVETGLPINAGEPMLTYVAMGINPMNEGVGPGWYDGSNYMWYQDTGYDNDLTTGKAVECIENCFRLYRQDPVGSMKFFVRKTVSQWCEPMFQSVWSGPLEVMGQQAETPFLQKLYRGEGTESFVCQGMKAFLLLVCILSFSYLWVKRKGELLTEYAYIFFLGGFLFHLFWEAKSQYTYPYIFVLLPSCAWMLNYLFEKATSCLKKSRNIDSPKEKIYII